MLRVLIPDELHGSLNTRTLPVRPNMNTRDVCRILAHKIRCTNPQDYGLFKLVQGEGKITYFLAIFQYVYEVMTSFNVLFFFHRNSTG